MIVCYVFVGVKSVSETVIETHSLDDFDSRNNYILLCIRDYLFSESGSKVHGSHTPNTLSPARFIKTSPKFHMC